MNTGRMQNVVVLFISLLLCFVCLGQSAHASESGDEAQLVPQAKEATLTHVIVKDRPAKAEELQKLKIVRQGKQIVTRIGMALQVGDRIETAADTEAVLTFEVGVEVYLAENSSAEIGSLKEFIGKLYAFFTGKEKDADKGTRKMFEVEAGQVTVIPEGTKFHVQSSLDGEVIVTVEEGKVSLNSNQSLWTSQKVSRLEQATVREEAVPSISSITQAELDTTLEWVYEIERIIQTQADEISQARQAVARPVAAPTSRQAVLQPTSVPIVFPTPYPAPMPTQIPGAFVPGLVGLHITEARQRLKDARIDWREWEEPQSPGKIWLDLVSRQSLPAGTLVRTGDRVDIFVEVGLKAPNISNGCPSVEQAQAQLSQFNQWYNSNHPYRTLYQQYSPLSSRLRVCPQILSTYRGQCPSKVVGQQPPANALVGRTDCLTLIVEPTPTPTPCLLPSPPTLLFPKKGAKVPPESTLEFSWKASSQDAVNEYEIAIRPSEPTARQGLPEIPRPSSISETVSSPFYTSKQALAQGEWLWKVRAKNSCGTGPFSEEWGFVVQADLPDLVVTDLRRTEDPPVLQESRNIAIPVEIEVRNQGTTEASVFNIGLQFIEPNGPNKGKRYWIAFTIEGQEGVRCPFVAEPLAAGNTVTLEGVVAFNSARAGQIIPLQAVVDGCGSCCKEQPASCCVVESDEGNNVSEVLSITIPPQKPSPTLFPDG
ncbi:MAG: hypothetical protein GY801_22380 [bacterium]|nr:hypothetical protein [bacterium]